jgi:hypothetical protein
LRSIFNLVGTKMQTLQSLASKVLSSSVVLANTVPFIPGLEYHEDVRRIRMIQRIAAMNQLMSSKKVQFRRRILHMDQMYGTRRLMAFMLEKKNVPTMKGVTTYYEKYYNIALSRDSRELCMYVFNYRPNCTFYCRNSGSRYNYMLCINCTCQVCYHVDESGHIDMSHHSEHMDHLIRGRLLREGVNRAPCFLIRDTYVFRRTRVMCKYRTLNYSDKIKRNSEFFERVKTLELAFSKKRYRRINQLLLNCSSPYMQRSALFWPYSALHYNSVYVSNGRSYLYVSNYYNRTYYSMCSCAHHICTCTACSFVSSPTNFIPPRSSKTHTRTYQGGECPLTVCFNDYLQYSQYDWVRNMNQFKRYFLFVHRETWLDNENFIDVSERECFIRKRVLHEQNYIAGRTKLHLLHTSHHYKENFINNCRTRSACHDIRF